jgi:signal transduction histidine kinase
MTLSTSLADSLVGVPGLYAWLSRHPRLVDGALAAPLALSSVLGGLFLHHLSWILVTIVMTVAIIVRRSLPTEAFVTAIVVGAVQVILGLQPVPSDLAIVVLLYTLAAYTTRRKSVIGLAICVLGSAAEVLRMHAANGVSATDRMMTGAILFVGPALIAWVLGDSMRYRRAYYANLEERAARLERDRDVQAKSAAAQERARIARELHDVVAHNVSVMVVQADGAAYAMDTDPSRAREALTAISATGRKALAEMRVLLGVLRQTGDQGEADLAPLPGLSQLDELLDQARAAGLAVSCLVEGTPPVLPDGTALATYRIIQESLTNVRKHAGPLASASVLLRYGPGEMEIIVRDDGLGSAAPSDGAGHGMTGMSERAAIFGGSVQSGPRPGGGFEVSARLPLAAPAHAGAA